MTATNLSAPAVAIVVSRGGRLPTGAAEAAAETDGRALVVGTGAAGAAAALTGAIEVWWAETVAGPGTLAAMLAPPLRGIPLVVLPASPDGRDLGPRLAAELGRPLLAGATRATVTGVTVEADLLRVDGSVVVPVRAPGPAVVTLLPGSRSPGTGERAASVEPFDLGDAPTVRADAEVSDILEPDPATMDLADAPRVFGGGAGLVPRGASDEAGRAILSLLADVAAALGASAGATRVVTDAGWMPYDRQIGTTGVTIDPQLYVAFGVSGASQHVGGLGNPRHTVSVNTDASSPMTSTAGLGLVTDALGLLIELAERLGLPVPDGVPAATQTKEGSGV